MGRPGLVVDNGRRTHANPALVSPVGTINYRQEVLSMSKKRVSHLRGERGQAFAELIRGVSAERILCVSGGALHRRH